MLMNLAGSVVEEMTTTTTRTGPTTTATTPPTGARPTTDAAATDRRPDEDALRRRERAEAELWVQCQLRGSLNALNLCLRALESDPPEDESRQFAGYITQAVGRIERLLARLRPPAAP